MNLGQVYTKQLVADFMVRLFTITGKARVLDPCFGRAKFVAHEVHSGYKSAAEGVDLEFDKEGIHYFVSVKSGSSWSNSPSMKKQKEQYIVEPLGFKAKEKNDEYYEEYGRMINKFTQEFIAEYCDNDGNINWDKIVRLNAAIKQPSQK